MFCNRFKFKPNRLVYYREILSGIVFDLTSISSAKDGSTYIKWSLKADTASSLSVMCLPTCLISNAEVLVDTLPKTLFMVFYIFKSLLASFISFGSIKKGYPSARADLQGALPLQGSFPVICFG